MRCQVRSLSSSENCKAVRVEISSVSNAATKRCAKCKVVLEIDCFGRGRTGRIASYCKPCTQVYCRAHYAKNAKKHNKRRYQNSKANRARNRTFRADYLKLHPCVDCGEADILVLEFDHVDPSTKKSEVADLSRSGYSLDELQREIAKCEVRCIKCHRRRTARQFGWAKGMSPLPGCSSAW